MRNSGEIDVSAATATADGGEVRITSDNVIAQFGAVRANATGGTGGTVVLESGDTTSLSTDSVVEATSSAGTGGTVHLLGPQVGLFDNAKWMPRVALAAARYS